jgi:hypothetical protein
MGGGEEWRSSITFVREGALQEIPNNRVTFRIVGAG